MSARSATDAKIERIARKFRVGEEPSLVDEYAHLTNAQRAHLFIELRRRVFKDSHEADRGLERVCEVVRRP